MAFVLLFSEWGFQMRNIADKEYVIRMIQDLRVKARDVDDFMEKKHLQKVIEKMEQGFIEEYGGLHQK